MKTIPAALAAHYALPATSICQCLEMTLRDGTTVAATTLDKSLVIDGLVYEAWLDVSQLVSQASLGADNLELKIVTDEPDLLADLEAGRYDNAAFYLFEINYETTSDGVNDLKRGTTGEAQITDTGSYTLEFRGLTQALQQPVGIVTQRTCRAHFADYPRVAGGPVTIESDGVSGGSPCRLDPADWTETGTITTSTSRQIVIDTSRTEADDWFTAGFLKFTSGLNANYERQIRSYIQSTKTFTFTLPFPFDIDVGDAYSVIAGCQKRLTEDCKTKFSNVLNFQGEPHLPGIDTITKVPGVGT